MTREQRAEYARTVWSEITRRRGSDWPLMTSAEWWTVTKWMDQEIPLRVVLRGIEDCKQVNNLLYVRPSVERATMQWKSRLAV